MKCPKCDYVSFDYNQSCPKCNKDIGIEQKKLNLPGYEPVPPFFLASLIGAPDNGTSGFGGTLRMDQEEALPMDASPTVEADDFEMAGIEDANEGAADLSELDADGVEKEIQIGEDALSLNLDDEVQGLEEPDVVGAGEEEPPLAFAEQPEDEEDLSLDLDFEGDAEPDVVGTGEGETPFSFSEALKDEGDHSLDLDLEEAADPVAVGPGETPFDFTEELEDEGDLSLDLGEGAESTGLEEQPGDEIPAVALSDDSDESDFSLDLADLAEEIEDRPDKKPLESLDEMGDDDLFDVGGLSLDEDASQEGPLFTESEMVTMELETNRDDSINDLEELDFELDLEDAEKGTA